jgi:hypothetical protein
MKIIDKDEQLVKHLSGRNSLLDATLEQIRIFLEDGSIQVELEFAMRTSSVYRSVTLKFMGVTEYAFYNNDKHGVFYVEGLKFFQLENGMYYISLDPYEEAQIPSDQDQDIVVAESVSGFTPDT